MIAIERLAMAIALQIDGFVTFWPEYERRDIVSEKRLVVPSGIVYKQLNRRDTQKDYRIDIGLLSRATEDDVGPLVEKLEGLAKRFVGGSVNGLACVDVRHDPLYSVELLREKRLFVGVLKLTFRGVV
mgnify:CR=1 FL=1|nr:MAG TPA: hypothetical protein [Caudoviricetes sp.]